MTLPELMVVVAIVAVLAAIGVGSIRKFAKQARTSEARAVMQAIRAAQEQFWACGTYMDATSGAPGLSYPNTTPNGTRFPWLRPAHTDFSNWQTLNVQVDGGVLYGYRTHAGRPFQAMTPTAATTLGAFPVPEQDWYVIEATGDRDENSVLSIFVMSSLQPGIHVERPHE